MNPRRVRVHIETLVLEGLALEPAHGAVVERALREELERLLAGPPGTGRLPPAAPDGHGVGHPLEWTGPAALGRELARTLFRGVESHVQASPE